ncbi:Por secretion system C-terminal sorting domain-containing protein [Hymenobacter daecheongensis DSM 21074]|uniref:Por secretion system C-terminal sorting domain-containing protein n=1 Tax=Hymenobacter daecheongensis DSM 21074 TaxID=1121955 RepID=A0A1M6MLS9_9BACT|nr:T9SS type A sorting domain-containing protein [Hymenobacter daecheongensis]SHJ84428.1 Por secretion system C-terminal sorting domain-containing protein [Hymenobacter daecheongensis DSM 21074]
MKRLLLLFALLTTLLHAGHAQYQTPGTGRRWNLAQLAAASGGYVTGAGTTFQINDTIRLAPTDTLVIMSNATVRMASLALFYVDGVLLVNPRDSVKITAINPAAPFHSFWFSGTSNGSRLRKTIVEYGGGLKAVDASLVLDSCVVRYQVSRIGSKATNSGAISLSGGAPSITNCRIYGNARSGILSPSNRPTSAIIRNNVLVANSTENGNWPQINLGVGGATPTIIENNLVVGRFDMAGGVSVSNLLGSSAVTQVRIRRNVIRNNRYGVAIVGSNINSFITQNMVENNNINPNAQTGGSGLNFQGGQTQTGVVSRNIIRGNLYGVTMLRSTATAPGPRVSFGNLASPDTTDVGRNRLTGNGNGGQIYDFYNNTADAFTAENNDWGSASAAVIETHIFHQPDNAALGLVDFQPFLTPVTTRAAAPATLAAAVFPNPATEQLTFALPASPAPAELRVYDVAGRVRATVAVKPVNGRFAWSVGQLAAGLYTYRLTQGATVATGKFAVAR